MWLQNEAIDRGPSREFDMDVETAILGGLVPPLAARGESVGFTRRRVIVRVDGSA